jgi:AraC-like DNA-binding protein
MSEPTVSAGYAKALLAFAMSKGAPREALLSRAGLRDQDLEDQDDRVPMSRYIALMTAGRDLCAAPALALEFCEGTRFEDFSVVGLICQSADTMGEALVELNRFRRLVIEIDGLVPGERFRLTPRDDGLWLEDQRPPDAFPELTELAFGRFICEVARHYPGTPFVKQLLVTHPAPAHAEVYERILQVPVTFGADRNAMRIDPSWLSLKIHKPNPYVFGVLSAHAAALLEELQASQTMRGRVERLIMPLLHKGDAVGKAFVARELGLSGQTLYRRLKAEGVSFEHLLDDLRHRLAVHYLDGRKVSVSETAYLVGFADASAFSRAFKRWTGASPRGRKA